MLSIRFCAALNKILKAFMNYTESDGFSSVHDTGAADLNDGVHLFPLGQGNAVQDCLICGGGNAVALRTSCENLSHNLQKRKSV